MKLTLAATPIPLAGCLRGGSAGADSPLWTARLEITPLSVGGVAAWLINGNYSMPEGQVGSSSLAEVVRSGSVTEISMVPPSPDDGLVEESDTKTVHDGTVYRIRSEQVDTNVGTRYTLTLSDPSMAPAVPTVSFHALPRVDRTPLVSLS